MHSKHPLSLYLSLSLSLSLSISHSLSLSLSLSHTHTHTHTHTLNSITHFVKQAREICAMFCSVCSSINKGYQRHCYEHLREHGHKCCGRIEQTTKHAYYTIMYRLCTLQRSQTLVHKHTYIAISITHTHTNSTT